LKEEKKKELSAAEMNAASNKNPDDYEVFNKKKKGRPTI